MFLIVPFAPKFQFFTSTNGAPLIALRGAGPSAGFDMSPTPRVSRAGWLVAGGLVAGGLVGAGTGLGLGAGVALGVGALGLGAGVALGAGCETLPLPAAGPAG